MNAYVVWVEMDRARIFRLLPEGPSVRTLRRREIRHHTSSDPENHKNCDPFFRKIADALVGAGEILLVGPSLTREHLRTYLEQHEPAMGARVVGSLRMDITSDGRVLDRTRRFFRRFDLLGQAG